MASKNIKTCYSCLLHGVHEEADIGNLLARIRLMAIYEEHFGELEKVCIDNKNKYIRFRKYQRDDDFANGNNNNENNNDHDDREENKKDQKDKSPWYQSSKS